MRMNLASVALFDSLPRFGERVAIYYRRKGHTYQEVARQTSSLAAVLELRGIGRGTRVMLCLGDSVAFVTAFFAVLTLGATAVVVSATSTREELHEIALTTDSRLVIAAKDTMDAHGPYECILIPPEGPAAVTERVLQPVSVAADDTAYILFSSGSTGKPRGIPHRHRDLLHCAATFAQHVIDYRPDDVVLCSSKLSFGYALGCNLVFPLLSGAASILFEETPTPDVLISAADAHRPTILVAQPQSLPGLLGEHARPAVARLRLALVAGEPLSPRIAAQWAEAHPYVPLLDGYGTTEINSIFISNTATQWRHGSVGRLVPGFEVQIRNEAGQPVSQGTGELWVRAESGLIMYWRDTEYTAERIVDGWIRTGDLFECDAEGFFFMRGRLDNMLKIGCGQWISPQDVEDVLANLVDEVGESALVGAEDEAGRLRLKLYVRPQPGVRGTRALKAKIFETLARSHAHVATHLGQLEFVTDLPRTHTGKIDRLRLRSQSQTEFAYEC
jgi:benzoate-CoA ligase